MDFLFSCPVLKKLKHSHPTASHRFNLRKVKYDNGSVLGHNHVAKLKNGVASYESPPALYQHQIIQVLDSYFHHISPPELDSSLLDSARSMPNREPLYFQLDNEKIQVRSGNSSPAGRQSVLKGIT